MKRGKPIKITLDGKEIDVQSDETFTLKSPANEETIFLNQNKWKGSEFGKDWTIDMELGFITDGVE